VQFSAVAYSPRLVLFFVRDRILFHTLGVFVATFVYSLWTLAWVDRAGSGTVPLFSTTLVVVLVVISMALFSVLVQRIILLCHIFLREFRGKLRAQHGHRGSRAWAIA